MGGTYKWKYLMNIITEYWQVFLSFITLVVVLSKMRVDIDVLKDKVKTLFDLWNREK